MNTTYTYVGKSGMDEQNFIYSLAKEMRQKSINEATVTINDSKFKMSVDKCGFILDPMEN